MKTSDQLKKFIDAQQNIYAVALSEIKSGRKTSHWMWYIFPQIHGLGFSEMSKYYSIQDLAEAAAFLAQPILSSRLIDISQALLNLKETDAYKIFGSPDDMKLKSSMTLFAAVPRAHPVFEAVLEKFFNGTKDPKTLQIIAGRS